MITSLSCTKNHNLAMTDKTIQVCPHIENLALKRAVNEAANAISKKFNKDIVYIVCHNHQQKFNYLPEK